MMRLFGFVLGVSISFTAVAALPPADHCAADNLVVNGGFESAPVTTIVRSSTNGVTSFGLAGWRVFATGANAARFEVVSDPAVVGEGRNCVRITSKREGQKDVGIDTDYTGAGAFTVTGGVSYAVSFDLQHVSGENSVNFSARTFVGKSTTTAEIFFEKMINNVPAGAWRHYLYAFTPKTNGTFLIAFRPKANGAVLDEVFLLDNVRVAPVVLRKDVEREFELSSRFLLVPMAFENSQRTITVFADGKPIRKQHVVLADKEVDWWAAMDLSPWKGSKIKLVCDFLPEDSKALDLIEQGDSPKGMENLYREPLRPQFHFSAKRGQIGDPNGLVFYKGEYHLCFQHTPLSLKGDRHGWGHAVSTDLVHWQELDMVLTPDAVSWMASGSAAVDWSNSRGLGTDGQPAIVAFYTQNNGRTTDQCIAFSLDGRTFTQYSGNPVLKQLVPGNRDPRIFWHAPSGKWVMALYVYAPGKDGKVHDRRGLPANETTICFFTSSDMKTWTQTSRIEGFFECPDIFELPVDGADRNKRWVLTGANGDYMVGHFDGKTFKPKTSIIKGVRGSAFYAGQTFSDIPAADGRRIQIGVVQMDFPGAPFHFVMSLPLELKLHNTAEGIRMAWTPVKELETLRTKTHHIAPLELNPDTANPLASVKGELLELHVDFEPGTAETVAFNLHGATIVYASKKQELNVNGQTAPAPLINGRQHLAIYVDRTLLEVFAGDGLTYMTVPFIPKPDNQELGVSPTGGSAKITAMDVYELKSAWQ